jgi:regulator of protease activity HflC (stomatin/prohibitin superfamily)
VFELIYIKKYQRGLVFVKGDLQRFLPPGKYWIWHNPLRPRETSVEVQSTLDTLFKHSLLDVLVKEPALAQALQVVDLSDQQRALVWRDNRLAYILGPGKHALWREPYELNVETFVVDAQRFEHPKLQVVLSHPDAGRWLEVFPVASDQEALLFRDGELLERLGPGKYVFWKGSGAFSLKAVDLREQTLDVAGQEIMTKDKVTLRVNLLVTFRVADAEKAVRVAADHVQALYRESQLALRAAVGTRLLDAILEEKESIGAEVRDALSLRAGELGLAVRSVGLRDIVLPGEMKAILNQVIEAEKQAQANLIKRREETAAARSQANTAKLLAENPVLARMRELELLQEILAGTKATFVLGEGDLARRIGGLVASGVPDGKDK